MALSTGSAKTGQCSRERPLEMGALKWLDRARHLALTPIVLARWHSIRLLMGAFIGFGLFTMVLFVARIVRFAAQRIASNPRARDLAVHAAKSVADEAKTVAKEEDKIRAAGRSVRRVVSGLKEAGKKKPSTEPDNTT